METIDEKTCFANRRGRCKILNVANCEGTSCSFFKTEAQFEEGRKKALMRIASLDEVTKRNIIDTYYGGKMSVLDVKED